MSKKRGACRWRDWIWWTKLYQFKELEFLLVFGMLQVFNFELFIEFSRLFRAYKWSFDGELFFLVCVCRWHRFCSSNSNGVQRFSCNFDHVWSHQSLHTEQVAVSFMNCGNILTEKMQRYFLPFCVYFVMSFAVLWGGTVRLESGTRYKNSISHGQLFWNYMNSLCVVQIINTFNCLKLVSNSFHME